MLQTSKISHLALTLLIFLLPIAFVPLAVIPLEVTKVSLLVLASVIISVAAIVGMIRERLVVLPQTRLMWGVLVLPLVYAISAFVSSTPSVSFFGYALEPDTAASIIIFSILLFGAATLFSTRSQMVRVISLWLLSLAILAVFIAVRVFLQKGLSNPLGNWTDLGVIFGLLATLLGFLMEMLPVSKLVRVVTWLVFVVCLVLLSVINFSTAWLLTLGAAIILFVYLETVEKSDKPIFGRHGIIAASILIVLSLVFIWNPTIGTKTLSNRVVEWTGISNVDVRPSLGATLQIAKTVIGQNPVLGSGPNTFGQDWLLHKSTGTNATAFWNTIFPFGFGFLPSAIATTGLLGTLVWIVFLALFLTLGLRAVARATENRSDRFVLVSTFFSALFLWIASIVYTPSTVVLSFAFICTGLFISATVLTGVIGTRTIVFNNSKLAHFVSVLLMLVLLVGIAVFGYLSSKKVLSLVHFQRAVVYSNTSGKGLDEIETELGKAINLAPADSYWVAVSQVELARANAVLNDTKSSDKDKQTAFQNALSSSIAAIQNAIAINPSYNNLVALGGIYASLVPAPFAVEGAYEGAINTYNLAVAKNPETPEVPLLLARVELDKKNIELARMRIKEALSKKQDYADAYFLQSQLEIGQNNLTQAIASAETGVVLSPGNAGVLFQLGFLKYSNRDFAGAVDALKKAIEILPGYANAQYYLGLSLDALGQRDEALSIFEDLAKTNPDNDLVKSALENLRAGKSALSKTASTPTKTLSPLNGQ